MKLRSLVAAVAAVSVAATTTVTSFAAAAFKGSINEQSGMFACLLSDDVNVPLYTSYEPISDFVAVELTVKAEDKRAIESAIADGTWVGGALGFNSQSTSWAQHEWSFQDGAKELTFKATDTRGVYTLSYAQDTPIFAATDTYAQVWAQNWSESVVNFEIVEFKLLNSKGEDIRDVAPDPVTPDEPTVEVEPTIEDEPTFEVPTDEEAAAISTVEPTVEPTEDAGETENQPTTPDKGSADTGVAGVAVAAGIVALAGAAVVAARKRK